MLRAALENDPAGTMRYINHEIRSSAFIQQRLVQLDAAMNRHENTLQQFQKAFEKAENVDLTTYSVINQGPLLLPCRNILDAILVAQGRLQYARNMFDDRKEICRPDDLGGVEMLPWGLNYGVGIGTGVVEPAIKKCKDFDSAEVHELKMAFDLDAQQAEEVHTYNSGDDLSIDTYMEMDLDGVSMVVFCESLPADLQLAFCFSTIFASISKHCSNGRKSLWLRIWGILVDKIFCNA